MMMETKKMSLMLGVVASLLVFVATRPAVYAQGGSNGGNGGKAVRCPKPGSDQLYMTSFSSGDGSSIGVSKTEFIGTYVVMDYQRAYPEFQMTPLTDIAGKDEVEKALALVARLKRFNPARVKFYTDEIRQFKANQHWVEDFDINDTKDINPIGMCRGGVEVQVIIQRTPETSSEKPYVTHRANYEELSTFQKAVMIVHEVILRETRALRMEKPAESAARLNAFVFSKEIGTATVERYYEVLRAAGLLYSSVGLPWTTDDRRGKLGNFNLPVTPSLASIRRLLKWGSTETGSTVSSVEFSTLDRYFRFPILSRELFATECSDNSTMQLPLAGSISLLFSVETNTCTLFDEYWNRDYPISTVGVVSFQLKKMAKDGQISIEPTGNIWFTDLAE